MASSSTEYVDQRARRRPDIGMKSPRITASARIKLDCWIVAPRWSVCVSSMYFDLRRQRILADRSRCRSVRIAVAVATFVERFADVDEDVFSGSVFAIYYAFAVELVQHFCVGRRAQAHVLPLWLRRQRLKAKLATPLTACRSVRIPQPLGEFVQLLAVVASQPSAAAIRDAAAPYPHFTLRA